MNGLQQPHYDPKGLCRGGRMNTKQLIMVGSILLGVLSAGAERGDRLEDSIEKHGTPIAKLVRKNQVVYLFEDGSSTAREVYNLDQICIKSDFISDEPVPEEIVVPEPVQAAFEPVVSVPEAEPAPEPAAAGIMTLPVWIALSVTVLCGAGAAVLLKKRKSIKILRLTSVAGMNKAAQDGKNPEEESGPKVVLPNRQHREASAKLSRNELCFYKSLQTAVKEAYITTFHVDLERIIDLKDFNSKKDKSAYKDLQPVFIDFALLDPFDTSVSAVILLHDSRTEDARLINRRKFLHNILGEKKIPLIEINENYKYSPAEIEELIFKSRKQSAA